MKRRSENAAACFRLLLASLVATCSSAPAQPADTAAKPPAACPAGSHAADGNCVSTLRIDRAPRDVSPVRDHHTTVVLEVGAAAFLYVMGGTDAWKRIHDDVLRARIRPDGSLDAFEEMGKLPVPRAGHTAVLVGRRIIVSGGHSMDAAGRMTTLDSTMVAMVGDDGVIGPWRSGPRLPAPVMHHTCNAVGNDVLCVGGRITGNYTSKMAVRMSVAADGTLGAYQDIAHLEQTLGFHQAFVHDRALYVAGGLHRDAPMVDFEKPTAIWRLPIAEGGVVGSWEGAGELPGASFAAAAQTFRENVYFVGGQNERDEPVSTITRGTLTVDGRVTALVVLPARVSIARMHVHQTPLFGRWIYSVGGRSEEGRSVGLVDVGTFE